MPKGKGKGFNFSLLSSTNLWITTGARQDPPSTSSAMGSLLPLGPGILCLWHPAQAGHSQFPHQL